MKRYTPGWIIFFLLITFVVNAQFSRERSALNSIEKAKWDRAKSQLQKAIRKDSLNAYARYVYALYYFQTANPEFNIDSSYHYAMQSMEDYMLTSPRDRERMLRLPLDSTLLVRQRERIDSAAFERATRLNTEKAYLEFLDRFPLASQRERAVELRNEVAYIDALKLNTYQSFLAFLKKYPDSHRAHDAQERYDKLLFETMTKDKRLSSYEEFLKEYPSTPYRPFVEQQIFEISTAAGTAEAFNKFLNTYPKSHFAGSAKALLFYLLKESNQKIPTFLLNDSIRNVMLLEQKLLIPYIKDDKFGFFDDSGEEIIKPIATELSKDYLCGDISDDILFLENLIIARNGTVLFNQSYDDIDDLGNGFVAVTEKKCVRIIHKSGFSFFKNCVEDVASLDGNYLAIRQKGLWNIFTLTGRQLTNEKWDAIDREGEAFIFKKEKSYTLALTTSVDAMADQQDLHIVYTCDDYRVWRGGLIWLKSGNQQAVVSSGLTEKIPFGNYELSQDFFGAISKSAKGYQLFDSRFTPQEIGDRIKVSKPWVGMHQASKWVLIDPVLQMKVSHEFDSIDYRGPFALGYNNDTLRICFNPTNLLVTNIASKIRFIPGKDSAFFLLMEEGEKKSLYDLHGQRLFIVNFDKIEYYGENLFQIQKKDKKGLLSSQGKVIAQPEFDALGRMQDELIPVLKDKKFGLVDLDGKIAIKPVYERNILRYDRELLIAYKEGGYGLITNSNKPVTDFEFEEIRYWTDSVMLARKNFQWLFYDFVRKKILQEKIKDFRWVRNDDIEKVMIVHQENNFGVFSNRRGDVIPATFSDIVNVGSSIHPVYFTEKHVEEASIFVVIYYDANGKLLRRQVFEMDDYDRIYCPGRNN